MTPTYQAGLSVTFCLQEAQTQLGESIRLVGSAEALGNWNPESGIILTTTPELYPQWTASVAFKPTEAKQSVAETEYKYVRDRVALNAGFQWESIPNRRIGLPAGRDHTGLWVVRDPGFDQARSEEAMFRQNTEEQSQSEYLTASPSRSRSVSARSRSRSVSAEVSTKPFEAIYHLVGEEPINFGSFGAVWRCRRVGSTYLDHYVDHFAVKRIERAKLHERDVRNLFGSESNEGEIRLHASLKHPHIVELFEIFNESQVVSLVMELCDGGDFFNRIARHKKLFGTGLCELAMANVQRHLLSALRFLHEQLIVHRDVKCENVLLQHRDVALEMNTCKLCDFGFAVQVPAGGSLNELMGSPDTAAPELIRRMPYAMPVDLWGAGVVLYVGLAGNTPFFAKSPQEILRKVRAGDYSLEGQSWENRSASAKDFLWGLMTVSPEKRFTAVAALQHPWLREGQRLPLDEPSTPQRCGPHPLRRALRWVVIKLFPCYDL